MSLTFYTPLSLTFSPAHFRTLALMSDDNDDDVQLDRMGNILQVCDFFFLYFFFLLLFIPSSFNNQIYSRHCKIVI